MVGGGGTDGGGLASAMGGRGGTPPDRRCGFSCCTSRCSREIESQPRSQRVSRYEMTLTSVMVISPGPCRRLLRGRVDDHERRRQVHGKAAHRGSRRTFE